MFSETRRNIARNVRLIKTLLYIGALAIPASYYINKLRTLHQVLSAQITHEHQFGGTDILALRGRRLVSLPNVLINESHQYVLFRDSASKAVQSSTLPLQDEQKLLTSYLRHAWKGFATMPQAWILWLVSDKTTKKTFDSAWISSRNFEQGDRLCGNYVVLDRQPGQVEIGMSMGSPDSVKFIEGRIVIAIEMDRESDTAIFSSETLMWRRKDAGTLMPLERTVPKWFHELASWGLLDQGVRLLKEEKAGNMI